MQLRKLSLMRLTFSWVLINAGCVHAPPDLTGCANLGDSGHCVTYMTKKKYDVDLIRLYTARDGRKLTWPQVLAGAVLIPSDQFAWLKTWFDNYCHQNQCPGGIGDWNHFASELTK